MSWFASRTSRPDSQAMASVNLPSAPTGLKDGRPFSRPIWRSTSPKAGARWTKPVPSSVVTYEAGTTRQPSAPAGALRSSKGRTIVQPDERRPGQTLRDAGGGTLPQDRVDQLVRDDQPVDDRVREIGVDRHAGVRQQGPRCRRPDGDRRRRRRRRPGRDRREAAVRRPTRLPRPGRRRAGPARGSTDAVPQRGQYGTTFRSSYSSPWSNSCCRCHHTDSM